MVARITALESNASGCPQPRNEIRGEWIEQEPTIEEIEFADDLFGPAKHRQKIPQQSSTSVSISPQTCVPVGTASGRSCHVASA